jgi:hypothetical protein
MPEKSIHSNGRRHRFFEFATSISDGDVFNGNFAEIILLSEVWLRQ